MLRNAALVGLAIICLVVTVVTGTGILMQTISHFGLATGLFVISYFLTPWAFGKACTSEGEVFDFGAYLKYFGYWGITVVFCALMLGLVVILITLL